MRRTYLVYAIVFVYTLFAGLAIQKIILPYVFPNLHAGHGLLKGGDSVGFHSIATAMAEQIRLHGWSAWELRPSRHAPAGIAAALYAITGIFEPWIVLPLNAALFALAVTLVFSMAHSLTNNLVASFAATLPLLLFPSAAMIYADLHKDVWAAAGSMLIIFVWTRLAVAEDVGWSNMVGFAALCFIGALLVWVVRAYFVQVLLIMSLAACAAVVITEAVQRRRTAIAKRIVSFVVCLAVILVVAKLHTVGETRGQVVDAGVAATLSEWPVPGSRSVLRPLDDAVKSIATARANFITSYPNSGSMIDTDVLFRTFLDAVIYVPRALQIGLFAPFPTMWFTSGVNSAARAMRAVTSFEMAICYLLLPGVILALPLLSSEGQRTLAVALTSCIVILILLSLAVPNVGTLHRLRFPFLMLPVGFGAAGWVIFISHLRSTTRRRHVDV